MSDNNGALPWFNGTYLEIPMDPRLSEMEQILRANEKHALDWLRMRASMKGHRKPTSYVMHGDRRIDRIVNVDGRLCMLRYDPKAPVNYICAG